MVLHLDSKVSTAWADSAFQTYLSIRRDGWQKTKDSIAKSTFNEHVSMICECGLSIAALQNIHGLDEGSEIIDFSGLCEIDFDAQHPDWYEPSQSELSQRLRRFFGDN